MILEKNSKGIIVKGTSEREPTKHLNPKNFIGIDPDIIKNGFAVWNKKDQKLEVVTSLSFFRVMDELRKYDDLFTKKFEHYIVKIEGGWLSGNNNWHGGANYHIRQSIAKKVGQNHEAGRKIVEACIELDCPFEVVVPKPPIFAMEAYFQKVTGWRDRTNIDARSAARYVYGF